MAKVKGSSMIHVVKALRLRKEESRAILPMELRHYLENRILVSSWYPEEDHLALLRVLVKILPDQGMDIYEFLGHVSARVDLSGVYNNLLRPGNPVVTLKRGSILWQVHHDTGKFGVVFSDKEAVSLELADFGLPSKESCGSIKGWIRELITLSGGLDAVVVKSRCVLTGDPTCLFEAKWRMPAGNGAAAG